ncbi:MAG: DUF4178 domain-containing protein [Anaerolineae bacterium]|nr:DUF4178 domain-containing protein [Anaerolineae bacterium]
MKQLTCSSCGGPIEIENQFIRTVVCRFCDSSFIISGNDTLDETGKSAKLANYSSRLSIGIKGSIRGRSFRVIGRARYKYDDGFWDEWQITWDDGAPPDWLEEDEGYWTLYRRERLKTSVPAFEQFQVGKSIAIGERKVFVSERRKAKLQGSEGQFASVLPFKGDFTYIQGSANNQIVNVNFWADEIELCIGDELEHHELVIG